MWQERNNELYKKFTFKSFKEAFTFITDVAEIAKTQNHHPRWQNDWNKVEIWLSTHSAGKITDKDHKLAQAIDIAYAKTESSSDTKLASAKLYTDGGSRGNPGPSAGAFVICNLDNNVVEKYGFYIGVATNNQAEYQALLKGLQKSKELGIRKLNVFMDSELVVKQLNEVYKIKNNELKLHYLAIKKLQGKFKEISFTHVPRAVNKKADSEVNRILDEHERR